MEAVKSNLDTILDQIKFEIEKNNFKFGEQNHRNGELGTDISTSPNTTEVKFIFSNKKQEWTSIIYEPLMIVLCTNSDYQRRAELIKLAGTIMQWIDCIDRNKRAIAPKQWKQINWVILL